MTSVFRVHITKGEEYVYEIKAESAHQAEEIAESYVLDNRTTTDERVISWRHYPGSHLEVTSVRIPTPKEN